MRRQRVYSWLKVYSRRSIVKQAKFYTDLEWYLKRGYKTSGTFHSYNKSALHNKIVQLDGHFKTIEYNKLCETVRIGGGAKIKDIMVELLKHGRRLPNSGNHFEQTFAGAAITGTHGFGKEASMADFVLSFEAYYKVRWRKVELRTSSDPSDLRHPDLVSVTYLILKTKPVQSFKVTNCVCRLSDIKPTDKARAYAILPYSHKDPITMIAEYENNDEVEVADIPVRKRTRPIQWWRVKLWWFFDGYFPMLRKIIQRNLNYLKMKPFTVYTHPNDYDALYDPDPGLTGQTGGIKFSRWAYRPTYVAYNVSVFSNPSETVDIVRFAIRRSEELKSSLLRCFIAVRELSDQSRVSYTGNARGAVDAIDLYCSPRNAKHLVKLQKEIQSKFDVRIHYGKTVS